jgi:catechol 2,3-dioxygenase-like lactoylglutathione lyase family enzyme
MFTAISHITLLVKDQDASLAFYRKLGFEVHTDAPFGPMRWLTLCLPKQKNLELVLMRAESEQEKALVGKQGGDKPLFSLATDDCHKDYERLKASGITFTQAPVEEPWGISAALQDSDGNSIYICQSR